MKDSVNEPRLSVPDQASILTVFAVPLACSSSDAPLLRIDVEFGWMRVIAYHYRVIPHREFISNVIEWAASQPEVLGVALVGSCARGTEREDSDIDFVLITKNPTRWLAEEEWLERFGSVRTVNLEDYGLLQSRRVRYQSGMEVEFGITTDEWLHTTPIDEGSRRVMSDGHRILDDKAGLFSAFLDVLRKDQPNQEEAIHIVPYDSSWPACFQSERGSDE